MINSCRVVQYDSKCLIVTFRLLLILYIIVIYKAIGTNPTIESTFSLTSPVGH